MSLAVQRYADKLYPDATRVITRLYIPGKEDRTRAIIGKLMGLSAEDVTRNLRDVLRDFSGRHRNITKVLENHFDIVRNTRGGAVIESPDSLSTELKLLIGSYFTMEYSIESSALFNPSVVEDPDQDDLEDGQKRLIMSFRAVGEGHISSLVFRSCVIDSDNQLIFAETGDLVDVPEVITRYVYDKKSFLRKLEEMRIQKDIVGTVMEKLGETFIYGELRAAVEEVERTTIMTPSKKKVLRALIWVAGSHYEVSFSLDTAINERVIFPISYSETNGVEDARFVKFTDDDGSSTYYATYTAYNGYAILPKLLQTKDFLHFKIMPINGESAQNKGMSIFPRRINGKYAMISRTDGVNLYLILSGNINYWGPGRKMYGPSYHWNYVQVGNSGSPIETEKGWLVITHGVGPMRTYSLGAILLDLENPEVVIGSLREPLLIPREEEREGYVPSVVYSCGSIVHNGQLIMPYGISDYATGIAFVPLDELLDALLENPS